MDIKQIEAKDTYTIRQQILRSEYPKDSCHFDGDEDELTIHLGGYLDDKLVSVASFFFSKNDRFKNEHQYQLRGMATVAKHRAKGLSSALLKTSFPMIKNNHVDLLWCNARLEAVPFYEKAGFELASEEFIIEGVGPHKLMFKNI